MCVKPCQPLRMPITCLPISLARYTADLMTELSPGTSPPPVRMPILFLLGSIGLLIVVPEVAIAGSSRPRLSCAASAELHNKLGKCRGARFPQKFPTGQQFALAKRAWVSHNRYQGVTRHSYPLERYKRADVLRILRITVRQLSGWEKAGLVAAAESYSFFDLLQVKKLRDLSAKKVRPAAIRESLQAMQRQVAGMENPLMEAGTFLTKRP